jgi:hypothetical protein
MPIEFGFRPSGSIEELGTYMVQPSEGVFLEDSSQDETQIIAIICERDDSKGQVHILNPKDIEGEETKEDVTFEELPEPIATMDVTEGNSHEQQFMDEHGKIGTLVVRYVAGDEITSSKNIPLGLIYPN